MRWFSKIIATTIAMVLSLSTAKVKLSKTSSRSLTETAFKSAESARETYAAQMLKIMKFMKVTDVEFLSKEIMQIPRLLTTLLKIIKSEALSFEMALRLTQ